MVSRMRHTLIICVKFLFEFLHFLLIPQEGLVFFQCSHGLFLLFLSHVTYQ